MPRRNKKKTKLKSMIAERGMTLQQLQAVIEKNSKDGYTIGLDRLCKYSNTGKGLNVHLTVMVRIAKALKCSLDDIVEDM